MRGGSYVLSRYGGICTFLCMVTVGVSAHVGTSNAYYESTAGPYGMRVIVRTPGVIPGLAQISVRILHGNNVEQVTVRPLRADVGLDGAPPPDIARRVPGENHLFSSELWLMTSGSYSVHVTVAGSDGSVSAFVPVQAVAERRLAMGSFVGIVLASIGLFLFFGAVSIFGAAVRESVLEPGVAPDMTRRRNARIAMAVGAVFLAGVLSGGWRWWDDVDQAYRDSIYTTWSTTPDIMSTDLGHVFRLVIDDPDWLNLDGEPALPLIPDHGKLMHMFLVKASDLSAFAHVHPVSVGNDSFVVSLPPLPVGDYHVFADIVHESGFAPTLVDTVNVMEATHTRSAQPLLPVMRDPDDSWAVFRSLTSNPPDVYQLPSGRFLHWDRHDSFTRDEETILRFSLMNQDGTPSVLEPYMGMLSHAAVVRDDGSFFMHLHPSGSINLAAQQRFEQDRSGLRSAHVTGMHDATLESMRESTNEVSFPFVFSESGAYRIVVQVKTEGRVETAAFDIEI